MADDEFQLLKRVRERVRDRGGRGRAARRPQLAAAGAARPVRRAAQRDRVHPAARRSTAGPGCTGSCRAPSTRPFQPDRQQESKRHPVRRARTRPEPAALGPAPAARQRRARTDFIDGLFTVGGNGDSQDQGRDGGAPLRGQHVHARPLLRRLRRRAAVRARARTPSSCTPSSARCGSARARSRWCRAASGSGSSCRTHVRPRLPVRELRRRLHPARARADRRQRPGQRARLPQHRTPPSRSATTRSRW